MSSSRENVSKCRNANDATNQMSSEQKAAGDEPKQEKKAKKEALGPKQQRLVRPLTTADGVAEAGKIAGYGTRQSTH